MIKSLSLKKNEPIELFDRAEDDVDIKPEESGVLNSKAPPDAVKAAEKTEAALETDISPSEPTGPTITEQAAEAQRRLVELTTLDLIDNEELPPLSDSEEEEPQTVELVIQPIETFELPEEKPAEEEPLAATIVEPKEPPLVEETQVEIVEAPTPVMIKPILEEETFDEINMEEIPPVDSYLADSLDGEAELPTEEPALALQPVVVEPLDMEEPSFPLLYETGEAQEELSSEEMDITNEVLSFAPGDEFLDAPELAIEDTIATESETMTDELGISVTEILEEFVNTEAAEEVNSILEEIEATVEGLPIAETKASTDKIVAIEYEVQQNLEELVMKLFGAVDIDYNEESIKHTVQNIIQEKLAAAISEEADRLNSQDQGTRENKTKAVLNMIIQKLKQKLRLHLSLGRFVLQGSTAEPAFI